MGNIEGANTIRSSAPDKLSALGGVIGSPMPGWKAVKLSIPPLGNVVAIIRTDHSNKENSNKESGVNFGVRMRQLAFIRNLGARLRDTPQNR
ncbi:MAG: hypothetical protein ABI240_00665 [Sphingomonas sp.]